MQDGGDGWVLMKSRPNKKEMDNNRQSSYSSSSKQASKQAGNSSVAFNNDQRSIINYGVRVQILRRRAVDG